MAPNPPADSSSSDNEEIESEEDNEVSSEGSPLIPDSNPKPQTPPSDESDDNDEDDDSVSDHDTNKSLKKSIPSTSTHTPIVKAPTAAAKRPLEAEKADKEKKPMKKKKKVVDGKEEQIKFSPIPRLWNEKDEIVILEGVRDSLQKGINPILSPNIDAFLESVQCNIHFSVNSKQLRDKIKKLRKKHMRGGTGNGPSNDHDSHCYELMKEVWGVRQKESQKGKKRSGESDAASRLSLYPYLNDWAQSSNNLILLGEGLSRISDKKVKDLDEKLRELKTEELKIQIKRAKVDREVLIVVSNATSNS